MNVDVEMDSVSKQERLECLISGRVGSRIRELQVVIQQAGLVLRGWSETYHAKQLAQHAAMEVAGVANLANEIEVR
jgi:osmotically-inducible protein OsmY